MQALVYVANEQMAFREEAEAEVLSPDETLVEIEAVGICGSDMHAYLGHDPRRVPPLILGHEAAGKVIEGDLSGKRVVINPLITCGRCAHCLDGRQNLCAERDLIGMYGNSMQAMMPSTSMRVASNERVTLSDKETAAYCRQSMSSSRRMSTWSAYRMPEDPQKHSEESSFAGSGSGRKGTSFSS